MTSRIIPLIHSAKLSYCKRPNLYVGNFWT